MCAYDDTVCFSVFFCGTAMPLSFYRVHVGTGVSIFSMGMHVGMRAEYCTFIE